eukprot:COSAG02_NODE_1118_length_14469_cov_8.856228_10_plen_66_part_00
MSGTSHLTVEPRSQNLTDLKSSTCTSYFFKIVVQYLVARNRNGTTHMRIRRSRARYWYQFWERAR